MFIMISKAEPGPIGGIIRNVYQAINMCQLLAGSWVPAL